MPKIKPFNVGYFTIHNAVFDVMMPTLSPNAFKVLCVAIRQTLGWKRQANQISYSQFMTLSGIKSSTTVSKALTECLNHGYLARVECGDPSNLGVTNYAYRLNTDLEIECADDSALETGAYPALENKAEPENAENPALENGVEPALNFKAPTSENGAGPALNSGETKEHKEHHHDGGGDINQLLQFGITRHVAKQLLETTPADLVAAWIAYIESRGDIRNPPAYLVHQLKTGDYPPDPPSVKQEYYEVFAQKLKNSPYADVIQH